MIPSTVEQLDLSVAVAETVDFLQQAGFQSQMSGKGEPVGLVLGTGLGAIAEQVEWTAAVPYAEIPHFARSTAPGHAGRLLQGTWRRLPVTVMQGRFHWYEGYTWEEILFPLSVLQALGVRQLVLSNAAGALNPAYRVGDLMLLQNQIDLLTTDPFIAAQAALETTDFAAPYDKTLGNALFKWTQQHQLPVHQGTYVGVRGPNYETPAEYRFLRTIGGDAVGMSTIPAVNRAAELGMSVLTFSVITNLTQRQGDIPLDGDHVIQAAAAAERVAEELLAGLWLFL